VFLFHGLPQRSEKFYDLSGSVRAAKNFVLQAVSIFTWPRILKPAPAPRLHPAAKVTHFSLVAASVCGMGGAGMGGVMARSPRQLMVALCSVVWMTRLGTFCFLRISR